MKTAYQYHVKNLHGLEDTLTLIGRAAKEQIRLKNHKQAALFCRLYAFSLAAWAETRLNKLLCEPGGFSNHKRDFILRHETQYDIWGACIKVAFENKYQCKLDKLPATTRLRYAEIIRLMDSYLKPVITIRNKLAHGQWICQFKSGTFELDESSKQAIDRENMMTLCFKNRLLEAIADVVNDLVLSKPTFERDFDKHFKRIEDAERDLSTRQYKTYVSALRVRHERSLDKRAVITTAV